MTLNRWWIVAIALMVVAAGVGSYFAFGRSGANAAGGQVFGDMVATLQYDPGQIAAYVNGQPIPAAKVEAFIVLRQSGEPLDGFRPSQTPAQYLDLLIDDQIIYQAALSRGDGPTDAEVQAFATETKAGLEAFLQKNTPQANQLRATFDEVKDTPYGLDAYDSSPEMLAGFRQQLAISKLNGQIISTLPAADQQDQAKVQAALNDFLAQAKSKATIKIVMTLPN